ncbi:TAXI family TRAP transporter solute-binding subunit [Nocardiopsis composta]|uniref:TAXI family TRAP transporter solute-binding subunit n=1 Tax=Nocardiopsis composta TaxID=157465 RepID=A0A7W8QSE3_9ACTN|nr:TAXI family TRAP transporter solute-binding subunit [Nocardiopsis composta]MBB5435737.1 hypothetical protein [Nocardiopsis composta]
MTRDLRAAERRGGPSRRAVLAALAAGAAGALLGGCGLEERRELVLASGEPGGLYADFAELLAEAVNRSERRLRVRTRATGGSLDNLGLLRDGGADLALSLADAAAGGSSPGGRLRALGRVYENYTQLVTAADGGVRRLADLDGRRVSLGDSGAGAAFTAERILASAGLRPGEDVEAVHLPLAEAARALAAGEVDAFFWSGGVPTPALSALEARTGIRLVPLDGVAAELRAEHGPVYAPIDVPAGAYGAVAPVATVGVPSLLACSAGLADEVAAALVRVLVEEAPSLIPGYTLGTQFLSASTLIGTSGVPLHPGAEQAYRELHG